MDQPTRLLSALRKQEMDRATLELLHSALSVAGDRRLDRVTRFRAAGLASVLLPRLDATERLLTTVMRALALATDRPWVAMRLAEAAVLGRSSDASLMVSLVRVIAGAHDEGRHQTVIAVLTPTLSMVDVGGHVCPEWLQDAARHCDGWEFRFTKFLRAWTRRFGAHHPGIRAVVRRLPHLLDDGLPIHVVRALHAAEPTPEGWCALARMVVARPDHQILGFSFAKRGAQAVEALRTAIAGCDDDERRTVMSGWLSEICG